VNGCRRACIIVRVRIEIVQVHRHPDGVRARLRNAAGEVTLRVHGVPSDTPSGRSPSMELTVDDVILLGVNGWPSDDHTYRMQGGRDGTPLVLNGLVDAIDDDGMAYFRLGPDSLTMIDADSSEVMSGTWLRLEFDPATVEAYCVI
jgi:hypothetical protein